MKGRTILMFVGAVGLMLGPDALAQHTQTVPSPPAGGASQSNRSGKTTHSKSTFTQAPSNESAPSKNAPAHQAGKKAYHSSSHGGGVGVGIGATIDLGGVGQRRAEPDPFAVGGPPISQTQARPEKPKTKKTEREPANTNPFATYDIRVIGPRAKEGVTSNPAVMDQAVETNPFANVNLTTAKAKDLEKQERNYNEKQQ